MARRVVVLGARGRFGCLVVEGLRQQGLAPLAAGRRDIDAEDPAGLRRGDVVLDAAGPYQERSTRLIEAACGTGFDVVDLNDDLGYAERVAALGERVRAAGIRVLTSCSSVSTIGALVCRWTGVDAPVRISLCLAPSARDTASAGSARSLVHSVGRPVRHLAGGEWRTTPGFVERRRFGGLLGRRFQSADALWLPRSYPSLESVDTFVDPNVPGLGPLLDLAARWSLARRLVVAGAGFGTRAVRWLGSGTGTLAYEIEDAGGNVVRPAVRGGAWIPVCPAILAAQRLALLDDGPPGIVPPDRHVDAAELRRDLEARGGVILDA